MNEKRIVLTGGTRGIGLGMVRNFLKAGHRVCITGRSQGSVDRALEQLRADAPAGKLIGIPCDAGNFAQVQQVWDSAAEHFGGIDIWINNAGVANPVSDFELLPTSDYENVVNTNLIGIMHACKVALLGMTAQGHGQIYNFEGFGSDGMVSPGLSVYGSTKRALTYFTTALIKENKEKPVNVGFLSPGIVITDMILQEADEMGPERWARTKRIYNILGDKVDTVSEWLAQATIADYGKHGSRVAWLTRGKAAGRFFGAFVLRRKRDLFSEFDV
jgi:NAD(P)-dependent dehydrogenase (short-subunit alcohol dehydrogenase family)